MTAVEVRAARPDERAEVARVMAAAFDQDPVVRWLCPDGRGIPTLFRMLVGHEHTAPNAADVAIRNGRMVGASLWDPPGHHVDPVRAVRAWPLSLRALRFRVPHGLALEWAFARHRPPGELWYLAELGAVEQGQGIGTALLEHRLPQVDGPAYLESTNERNLPLYERFGFRETGRFRLPLGGPWVWPMLRR